MISPGAPTRGFLALLVGMLMAQLDTNVVVAALPAISADLDATSGLAAVTAVYLLTVTIATPVYGALGDTYGARAVFVVSVALFAAGSVACALAPSLGALVAARSLQGLGGGGLVVTAVSTLAQLFDADELVRRQIWLTAVFAVSSLAGPPVGGLLAANAGWHWIFLINLPLCVAALAMGLALPHVGRGRDRRQFDVAAAVIIGAGGAAVILLGASPALATSPTWAPLLLATAAASAILLVRTERHAAAPLIPPTLFGHRQLARSIAVTAMTGVALFGSFTFIPLALAAGTGAGSGGTGGLLLALTGGQLAVMTAFSILARRHPRIDVWGRIGLAAGVAGLILVGTVPQTSGSAATVLAVIGLSLSGAALGLSMQAYTLIAQTTAPRESLGAAMATLTFARQLGGALGAAVFGWVLAAVAGGDTGLTLVFLGAAATIVVAAVVAPGAIGEIAHDTAIATPVHDGSSSRRSAASPAVPEQRAGSGAGDPPAAQPVVDSSAPSSQE